MLDQRLSTIPQHQWITKLFGYDFTVEYRPGRLNTVADFLSRRDSEEISLHTISTPTCQLDIRSAVNADTELSALRNNIIAGLKEPAWSVTDGLILKSGKVYIPSNPDLLQQISNSPTLVPMKDNKRHCSASALIFMSTMIDALSMSMSSVAQYASKTNLSPCTRPACYSPFLFPLKFGPAYLWISLRLCPRYTARV
jgi:hypothetical protein